MIEAALLRAQQPKHILFLCVANSARSQMAEGIARALAPASLQISSAGSQPASLRDEAVAVLQEIDIDASLQRAKGFADIPMDQIDAVITLCSDEVCPYFPRPVTQLHWALPDPAAGGGTQAQRLALFREVRDELERRLKVLLGP